MNIFYRKDIDGLRALAVLLVIICHAGFKSFSGGFIGVDIFFVISGFVVTNSITASLEQGRFRFSEFYVRRAKRLVPALYTVMLVTLAFGILLLVPDAAYSIMKNIGAVTIFSSNIYISSLIGYFDPSAENMPLLHTWSLSVEEQFYLVLPLLLFLLRRQSDRSKILIDSAILIGSLSASQWAVSVGSPGSYYLFQFRIFEFMLGVIATRISFSLSNSRNNDVVLLLGVAIIFACALTMDALTPFPGLAALLPCLGAVTIILSCQKSPVGQIIFGNRSSVMLGKLSYSLYLWHWPVFFAFRHFDLKSAWAMFGAIIVSLVLTVFTFLYIEQPLRQMKMSLKKAALLFIGMPFLLVVCLTATGKLTHNFLFLYPPKFQEIYKVLAVSRHDNRSTFAQKELPLPAKDVFGNPLGITDAVIWGDSHALSFRNFFDALGKEYNVAMFDMSWPGCPPVYFSEALAIPGSGKNIPPNATICKTNNDLVMKYILFHSEIKIVFISSRWLTFKDDWIKFDEIHPIFSTEQVKKSLFETVKVLQASGKKIVFIDDLPEIPKSLKDCVISRDTWFGKNNSCSMQADDALRPYNAYIAPVMADLQSQFSAVTVLHTYDVLCDLNWCHTDISGHQIYQVDDVNHLALTAGPIFYKAYREKHPLELDQLFHRRSTSQPLEKNDNTDRPIASNAEQL
ncbi:acyltransferase family protein [Sapientia aquatica]|uniref:acyltransferase family protein n=1 Tax=Sapientia aquatica TaxID=1549640 RepID=UPI001404F6BE|nr:acyltransferase family protein [Sapientia aquatica]